MDTRGRAGGKARQARPRRPATGTGLEPDQKRRRRGRFNPGRMLTLAGLLTVGTVWGLAFVGSGEGGAGAGGAARVEAGMAVGGGTYEAVPAWLLEGPSAAGAEVSRAGREAPLRTPGAAANSERPREGEGTSKRKRLLPGTAGYGEGDGVLVSFEEVVAELAEPEAEAKTLLNLLEHLPAQPPVVSAISSPYGWRTDPLDPSRRRAQFHKGVDFDVPEGTPVLAPAPGRVLSVHEGSGYGLYVKVRHEASGYVSLLAHLKAVADGVKAGTDVRRGQVIAFSGGGGEEDGRSTGPHVHFEVQSIEERMVRGAPVDPALVFDVYWKAWDAVQEYPLAKNHASFWPYTVSLR